MTKSHEQTPDPTRISLRVLSWNIRKALGTDRKRNPSRILDILGGVKADVVLLQEADFRMPPRRPIFALAEIEKHAHLQPVMLDHGRDSLGWHGNVVLTAPDLRHISSACHNLPGLEPRGAIEAVVQKNGINFRALGVHLGLLRGSRRQQLTAMLDFLPPDLPCLIAGDFNERSQSEGLGRLAKRFKILAAGPTYHARVPMFALDRIAITPEFQPDKLSVLRNGETALASDHLPLVADLTLTAQTADMPSENS